MDYTQVAKEIVSGVGGVTNVKDVKHCVTRLRFNLKDESIADTEGIKKIKEVLSVIRQGGQYQVVVGTEVGSVFDEVVKIIGNTSKDEKKKEITDATAESKTDSKAQAVYHKKGRVFKEDIQYDFQYFHSDYWIICRKWIDQGNFDRIKYDRNTR